MSQDMTQKRKLATFCLLALSAGILFACDLPTLAWPGSQQQEPRPFQPAPQEPQQQNPPAEQQPQQQNPQEPLQPEQLDAQQQQPQQQAPAEIQQPQQQNPTAQQQPPQQNPLPPAQPGGGSGTWTTDLALTDIYPGNKPYGQFFVRVTNNGPGVCNKVNLPVTCNYTSTHKSFGTPGDAKQVNLNLTISALAGETFAFATGLNLDTSVWNYTVTCTAHPGFTDPNSGNNTYTENIS